MSHCRPQTGGVKNILSYWGHRSEIVAHFGQATLHRHRDGRYELLGGTVADRADALEWASLFQHDAVFGGQPEVSGTLLSRSRVNAARGCQPAAVSR